MKIDTPTSLTQGSSPFTQQPNQHIPAKNPCQKPSHSLLNARWVGQSRQACLHYCQQHGYPTIQFAHWLAIAPLGIMLVFKNQHCIGVECITLPS